MTSTVLSLLSEREKEAINNLDDFVATLELRIPVIEAALRLFSWECIVGTFANSKFTEIVKAEDTEFSNLDEWIEYLNKELEAYRALRLICDKIKTVVAMPLADADPDEITSIYQKLLPQASTIYDGRKKERLKTILETAQAIVEFMVEAKKHIE
jgi:NAD(P)H-dependent flavin oxidoreductase YrpB (nitropropane dioxygenase family)